MITVLLWCKTKSISTNDTACMQDTASSNLDTLVYCNMGIDDRMVSKDCIMPNIGKGMDLHSSPQLYTFLYNGEWTDIAIFSQFYSFSETSIW